MQHKMTPNLKLSKEQCKIVLDRVLQKGPPAANVGAGGSLAQSLVSNRMGQAQPTMGPPNMPLGTSPSAPSISPTAPIGQPMPPPTSLDTLQAPPSEDRMELSPVEQQIQSALIADQLWKDSGGSNSVGSRIWGELQKGSGSAHLDTPRDYFISSFVKYKQDPVKFKRGHPREARLLVQLSNEFEASQGI